MNRNCGCSNDIIALAILIIIIAILGTANCWCRD